MQIKPADLPATRHDVADHVARELLGDHNLHLHHGFEQHRIGLLRGFLEGHRAGHLERHVRAVDLVPRATQQRGFDVHHRVAAQHAVIHRLTDALCDGLYELFRDFPAFYLVHKLEALALAQRLELDDHMRILPAPARLADKACLDARLAPDGFAVRHLRAPYVGMHAELTLHAVAQHFQVQLAHAADLGLTGLVVNAYPEGRIFVGQALQGVA